MGYNRLGLVYLKIMESFALDSCNFVSCVDGERTSQFVCTLLHYFTIQEASCKGVCR